MFAITRGSVWIGSLLINKIHKLSVSVIMINYTISGVTLFPWSEFRTCFISYTFVTMTYKIWKHVTMCTFWWWGRISDLFPNSSYVLYFKAMMGNLMKWNSRTSQFSFSGKLNPESSSTNPVRTVLLSLPLALHCENLYHIEYNTYETMILYKTW